MESGTYTVVIGCALIESRRVDLFQLTTTDLDVLNYARECSPATAMLTGALLGTMNSPLIQWGQIASSDVDMASMYTLPTANGTHDLLATNYAFYPNRLIVLRDVTSPSDHADLDFDNADTIALESHSIDVLQWGSDTVFVSANGTAISLGIHPDTVIIAPAAAMASGDLNVFERSFQKEYFDSTSTVSSTIAARELPTSLSSLPAEIDETPSGSWVDAGGHGVLRATWTEQPDAVLYRLESQLWHGQISPAMFGTTGTLELPDLSAVTSWDQSLNLDPGSPPGSIKYGVEVSMGAPLEEQIRPFPSREGEIRTSGWILKTQ